MEIEVAGFAPDLFLHEQKTANWGCHECSSTLTASQEYSILDEFPEFNVMDFAVWSEVERRMRRQERSFPKSKRETRGEFILRLQRTARNLSKAFLTRSIADLRRRCELCYKAKGGLFEEGGRSPSSRRRL